MTDEPETCAVWYVRYGTTDYELCDDEASAVGFASAAADGGYGAIYGVQYRDGRTVRVEDWEAYKEAERRRDEFERARQAELAAQPKRPTRQVMNPFNGKPVEVDADEPDWLGVRDV